MTTGTSDQSSNNNKGSNQQQTGSDFVASLPDEASRRDNLGFGPYVRALARFLTSKHTQPPLTVSVEGE